MGLTMNEALQNMLERTSRSASMRAFVQAIVQGETMGVSIGKTLRDLAVDMRKRRRQAAEERAQKAPIKLLFPLTFLILPAMMIVILGPAVRAIAQASAADGDRRGPDRGIARPGADADQDGVCRRPPSPGSCSPARPRSPSGSSHRFPLARADHGPRRLGHARRGHPRVRRHAPAIMAVGRSAACSPPRCSSPCRADLILVAVAWMMLWVIRSIQPHAR